MGDEKERVKFIKSSHRGHPHLTSLFCGKKYRRVRIPKLGSINIHWDEKDKRACTSLSPIGACLWRIVRTRTMNTYRERGQIRKNQISSRFKSKKFTWLNLNDITQSVFIINSFFSFLFLFFETETYFYSFHSKFLRFTWQVPVHWQLTNSVLRFTPDTLKYEKDAV